MEKALKATIIQLAFSRMKILVLVIKGIQIGGYQAHNKGKDKKFNLI